MKDNTKRINELAVKLKKGDKKVFEELYKLTSSKAYFVALQICGDKHEAEDIVQESYVTALSKISALEKTESFMSWFNRIVANKSKDALRKKNPKLFSEEDEWMFENQADKSSEFMPEENVDRNELRSAVMEAVQDLSAEKRACVLMKYFDNMSVNDISESLEVPVSTVKNRLWIARKELKEMFERKGVTAAYSVAPFGVITWALNASYEAVAQSFEGSAAAAKILSGITVAAAGTAAAGTAAAGTAAASAGSGIAAKIAAASTAQKIVSGLVVAGVVTGSTIGITTAVKDKTPDLVPSTAYTETVDYAPYSDMLPAVNEVHVDPNEESETHDTKFLDFNVPGGIPKEVKYKGTLKLGDNHVDFEDGIELYYVDFDAVESGYYSLVCDYEDEYGFGYVFVANDSQGDVINGFYEHEVNPYGGMSVYYLEEGENTIVVAKGKNFESSNIAVEYLGEEITDIEIDKDDLNNVVLGYDEPAKGGMILYQDQSSIEKGRYANHFRTKIKFSSGKTYDMGDSSLNYVVKDGHLKEGKNEVVFTFFGKEYEKVITARPITDYVKNIEISNLDEFTVAQIGEEGFVYEAPEKYEVTVTYADSSEETFDGATWDRVLKFDNGVELKVDFFTSEIRDREPLKFVVSIGQHVFIERICVINEFDVIGYRKALDKINLETAKAYKGYIEEFYVQMENDSDGFGEFVWYSNEVAKSTAHYSLKFIERIAGFELDYAITTYKILTENDFDLV